MSETCADPLRKRLPEDGSSMSANGAKKKDKKWWEVKREKKKAKRTLAELDEGNADRNDSAKIGALAQDSTKDQHVMKSQTVASEEVSTDTKGEKKKKKKSKNKAMSAHATYGADTNDTSRARSDQGDDGEGGEEELVPSASTSNALEVHQGIRFKPAIDVFLRQAFCALNSDSCITPLVGT